MDRGAWWATVLGVTESDTTGPRLGADCGTGHKLLIGKFRLKLKKVGKSTTPFRYDLN